MPDAVFQVFNPICVQKLLERRCDQIWRSTIVEHSCDIDEATRRGAPWRGSEALNPNEQLTSAAWLFPLQPSFIEPCLGFTIALPYLKKIS